MKKIVALLLAVAVLFGCLGIPTVAEETPAEQNSIAEKICAMTDDTRVQSMVRGLYNGFKNNQPSVDLGDYHILIDDGDVYYDLLEQAIKLLKFYATDIYYVDFNSDFYAYVWQYSDHFEAGFVSGYEEGKSEAGDVVEFPYIYKGTARASAEKIYRDGIKKIVNSVSGKGFSDLQKVVAVHDYIVSHFEYDSAGEIYDPVAFLRDGKGVCEAYTKVFYAVMEQLGISSYVATDDPHQHSWNVVKLGNNYYHVDCTHDDVYYDKYGMVMKHDSFLLNDTVMVRHHQERFGLVGSSPCWTVLGANVSCNSSAYMDMPWNAGKSEYPITYCDGNWYIMIDDGVKEDYTGMQASIYRLNANMTAKTLVTTVDSVPWEATNGNFWPSFYSGFFAIGDTLYWNTSTGFWSYRPKTGVKQKVADWIYDRQVYGCRYEGKGVVSYITKAPDKVNAEDQTRYTYSLWKNGDVTGEGSIDANDLIGIRRQLLSGGFLNTAERCDLNGDNKTDIADLIHLKKYLIHQISVL